MLQKTINVIWIGDDKKCPHDCIGSWVHGDWDVQLWNNDDIVNNSWILKDHMKYFAQNNELNGVADCMRWQILYENGGFFVDADSQLVQPLPEWLTECKSIYTWENEIARPGLIACSFMAAHKGDVFVEKIIEEIKNTPVGSGMAWEIVGPQAITNAYYKYKPTHTTILPSHFFIPQHFAGFNHTAKPVYAIQKWGSTRNSY